MAATKQRSSKKPAAKPAAKRAASRTSRNGQGSTTKAKSQTARARSRTAATANGATGTAKQAADTATGTAANAVNGLGHAIKSIAAPVGTAVIGTAAGLAIGKATFGRKKKVLGITMPGQKDGLQNLARNVNEAGKQFGQLAGEIREARKKAEGIGKALS
jgi:hypothetical protein